MLPALFLPLAALAFTLFRLWACRAQLLDMARTLEETPAESSLRLTVRLESSAVDCWDNPIGAGPHSTCLERDISSRMNRYASDPDITDVWIWYESIGENSYNIYIGYA